MMAAEVDGAVGRDPGLGDVEAGAAAVLLQRVEDGREPVAVCKRNSPKTARRTGVFENRTDALVCPTKYNINW